MILNDCEQEDEEDLPAPWSIMANQSKYDGPLLVLLQNQITLAVAYFDKTAIHVTIHHISGLKYAMWPGHENTSNINSGLLPFTVTTDNQTSTFVTVQK